MAVKAPFRLTNRPAGSRLSLRSCARRPAEKPGTIHGVELSTRNLTVMAIRRTDGALTERARSGDPQAFMPWSGNPTVTY